MADMWSNVERSSAPMWRNSRVVFGTRDNDYVVTTTGVSASTICYLTSDGAHICGRITNIGVGQEINPDIDPDLLVDVGL